MYNTEEILENETAVKLSDSIENYDMIYIEGAALDNCSRNLSRIFSKDTLINNINNHVEEDDYIGRYEVYGWNVDYFAFWITDVNHVFFEGSTGYYLKAVYGIKL